MIRFYIGMKATEKAATEVTYKTVWVAGPSIEDTHCDFTCFRNCKKIDGLRCTTNFLHF